MHDNVSMAANECIVKPITINLPISPAISFSPFNSSCKDCERSIRMYKSRGKSRSGVTVTEKFCGSPRSCGSVHVHACKHGWNEEILKYVWIQTP